MPSRRAAPPTLCERHAHHLRRGLGDDRVAAGADVGHVGFDRDDATACRAARARRTSSASCCGTPAATPMPISQSPVAHRCPASDCASSQPKRSAPRRRHSTSWRCENGRSRLLRIDLGIVEDAELDRVDAELLRHLVHRDLERHHARRLARRAHRIAFGQVEHGEASRGHAVCAA